MGLRKKIFRASYRSISISTAIIAVIAFTSCQTNATITTTPSTVPSTGLPLVIFSSDDFAGSGNCAVCHTLLTDAAGNDVSIDSQWRSTMMANAAKDPFWQAKVASEVARNPALKEVIEDKCATCHMPMAYTQAEVDSLPTLILDDGFLSPANTLNEAAMDGNSCTLCHQIQSANLGQAESFGGNYQIDTDTVPPDRPIFGPFPDQFQSTMQGIVGFNPVQGLHIEDAGLCATCHTVYTPYVDSEGNVLGTFPEQTAYLEWEHSSFGAGVMCQICHMPTASGSMVIANQPSGLTERSPFNQHHFVGGNALMLYILKNNIEELAITASPLHLETTLGQLLKQLQNRTAGLSIVDTEQAGDALTVMLKVGNQTGHKFPTGFPSRRTWIHLTVTDAGGQVIFESGKPNDNGSITGNNADEMVGDYEPHYDIISQPDQVQIYESIMQDSDGYITYTLLRGADYAKDNRILPQGFDKETAAEDIAVHGVASTDDNFIGGSDEITYQINTKGYSGPFTITAELLYQTVSYQFIQDLYLDSHSLITLFAGLYQEADKIPTQIATISQTVS